MIFCFMNIIFLLGLFSLLFYNYFDLNYYKISLPVLDSILQNIHPILIPSEDESFVQFSTHFNYSEENSLVKFAPPSPSDCPRNIVFGKTGGRLGNLMCAYATYLAYTLHTNRAPVIEKKAFDRLNYFFKHVKIKSEADIKLKRGCRLNFKPLDEKGLASIADYQAAFKRHPNQNIKSVRSYYRFPIFNDVRKELMESFQLRPQHRTKVEKTLRNVKVCHGRKCTYVCVHVRRTDQKKLVEIQAKGKLAGKAYVYNAMKIMKSKFSDSVFLIISEDMKWCRKNLRFKEFKIEFISDRNIKNPILDLGLLMYSNHSIITHGTFGFIGAFLSGGHVIQPIVPGGPGPQVGGIDLMKKGKNWIQIKV